MLVTKAVNTTVIIPIMGMTIKPTKLKGAKQKVARKVHNNSLSVTGGDVWTIVLA
jgi:hypothetical protein